MVINPYYSLWVLLIFVVKHYYKRGEANDNSRNYQAKTTNCFNLQIHRFPVLKVEKVFDAGYLHPMEIICYHVNLSINLKSGIIRKKQLRL